MALPRVFANLVTAAMSFLDDDFNALAALITIQGTASGTNAITITPGANQPAVGAYGLPNPVRFGFVAPATSTGPVTARVNALTFLNVYLPTLVQANTGDIAANAYYEVVYNAALNTGAGGWVIASALPGTGVSPVAMSASRGLLVTNNAGTPSTKIDISASKMTLVTSTGSPVFVNNFAATCDLTTNGLNGMDTGSRPTSGWVYLYALSNGSLTGCIGTATSPTAGSFAPVPSGYIYSHFVGAMFLDGSQNLKRSRQTGRKFCYTVVAASNTAAMPIIGSGTAGAPTIPTWVSLAVAAFVPLTAGSIKLVANPQTGSFMIVAPNNAYGSSASTTNGPTILSFGNAGPTSGYADMVLESANIFWANAGANNVLYVEGYEDYYVN